MDGINNVNSLTAQIGALKAMEGTNSNGVDPDEAVLAMEKTFSQMLNNLVYSSGDDEDSSSIFGSFISSSGTDTNSLLGGINAGTGLDYITAQQNILAAQRLSALEENSSLLGREIIYVDADTQSEKTGVVEKLLVTQSALPLLVLTDGTQVAVSDLIGMKK